MVFSSFCFGFDLLLLLAVIAGLTGGLSILLTDLDLGLLLFVGSFAAFALAAFVVLLLLLLLLLPFSDLFLPASESL